MDKTYQPQDIEQKHYSTWEKAGHFSPKPGDGAYSIVIPPPNVTGTLHMGHAFQHTLMDALIRLNRMKGKKTLWQPGTDHAGIATQMVVERLLNKEGKTRHELGRDAFVDKIWDWKNYSGGTISQQMRRLGDSTDWSRERFTMDEGLSEAVQQVFIQLYEEGLIYRGKRLVNWDPVLQTAVSDLEVISTEEAGHLWHMKYPVLGTDEVLVVATTRPETLFGDSAVAVHPEDERYQHLIGKEVALPLTDRHIPIIQDEYVDKDFGTGCVKITPAHDFNDNEVGKRHDLPLINIFTPEAKINENAPEGYQGLDRVDARKKVIADLENKGLLDSIKDHTLMVPRGDRSQAVIEPYLTDQWFVKIQPLADPAIEAVKNGSIKFVPENWSKTYFQWMENIQDWCISRQLWWGHRIPAYYDEQGGIYVGDSEAAVRKKHGLGDEVKLRQDEDVLDTWFSSALWPFSTLGWPDNTQELNDFLPTNVLVTGFDIIFFWVARMIMFTLKFTGKIPFHEVYITGLIRDEHGQKMSKSKGNVLDPIDLIDGITINELLDKRTQGMMQPELAEKIKKRTQKEYPEGIPSFGTDALRFTFSALASSNRDIQFDLSRVEGYRNFCNKLWNAARYVLMQVETVSLPEKLDVEALSFADRWILNRLQDSIIQFESHIEKYRFDLASQVLYEFTWNHFCDWYVELSKPSFWKGEVAEVSNTAKVLVTVMESLLKLLHPFMPFITEEIWSIFQEKSLLESTESSIMNASWPVPNISFISKNIDLKMTFLTGLIREVRHLKKQLNLPPKQEVKLILSSQDPTERESILDNEALLKSILKVQHFDVQEKVRQKPEKAAMSVVGKSEIFMPLEGLINLDEERLRLLKKADKLKQELDKINKKLTNEGFLNKAPDAIVSQLKSKQNDFQKEFDLIQAQVAQLA